MQSLVRIMEWLSFPYTGRLIWRPVAQRLCTTAWACSLPSSISLAESDNRDNVPWTLFDSVPTTPKKAFGLGPWLPDRNRSGCLRHLSGRGCGTRHFLRFQGTPNPGLQGPRVTGPILPALESFSSAVLLATREEQYVHVTTCIKYVHAPERRYVGRQAGRHGAHMYLCLHLDMSVLLL